MFEFNQFCTGNHPCYNGKAGTPTIKFDGSKGNWNCIIGENSWGVFYDHYPLQTLVLGPADHKREFVNEANNFDDLEDCYFNDERP